MFWSAEADAVRARETFVADVVSELYSPPRIAAEAAKFGLRPGSSLELRTGWDLSDPQQQRLAEKLIETEKPWLLVTCPPCSAFSTINALNLPKMLPERREAYMEKGREHLRWCMAMCQKQVRAGRYFMHEHPRGATSWGEEFAERENSYPEQSWSLPTCVDGTLPPKCGTGPRK